MCLDLVVRTTVQEKEINTDDFTNTNSENKPGFRVENAQQRHTNLISQLWEMLIKGEHQLDL